jgi:hypothetical protein
VKSTGLSRTKSNGRRCVDGGRSVIDQTGPECSVDFLDNAPATRVDQHDVIAGIDVAIMSQ